MIENIPFLPQDIIINILSKLPAKTIGQCRCVSKLWRFHLSQPNFIKIHLHHIKTLQQMFLIFPPKCDSLSYIALPAVNEHPETLRFAGLSVFWRSVFASCDGLVLLGKRNGKLFLVNPVTREIREVPPSPFDSHYIIYAIGYDSVHDDYKIVNVSFHKLDSSATFVTSIDVYSLKNDSWKKVQSPPSYLVSSLLCFSATFVDGCIHWVVRTTSKSSIIMAFDLAQESFFEVPPPSILDTLSFYSIVELEGCLCLCKSRHDSNYIDVWMMKEYGNKQSWTKFSIASLKESEDIPLFSSAQDQLRLEKDIGEQLTRFLNCDFGEKRLLDGLVDVRLHTCQVFFETLVSPHYKS